MLVLCVIFNNLAQKPKIHYMKLFLRLFIALFVVSQANAQFPNIFKKKKAPAATEKPKPKKEDKNGMKPYDKVITKKAISDAGLLMFTK